MSLSGKRIPFYVARLPVADGELPFLCRKKLPIAKFAADFPSAGMLRRLADLQDAADKLGFAVFIAGFTAPRSDPQTVAAWKAENGTEPPQG